MLPPHYLEYREVFEKRDFDTLPKRRPWDHVIEMTPDFKPTDCKVYPLTGDEQKALKEFLDENLRTKWIRPSKSPMVSPFFFVKKKDGKLQPIQDYRKLNEMMTKNRYPLPLIKDLVDHLKYSQSSTYDGDTTTSGSKRETNGKRHSGQIKDCLNQQSCSSDWQTRLQCSSQ